MTNTNVGGVTTVPPDQTPLLVRQAERADLLDIFRIESACFPQPWPFAAFEQFLGEPAFLVGERDDTVVGYVVGDVVPNYGRDIGHVKDLAVHPEHRGSGVGRELLERALFTMLVSGASIAKLEVREGNDPALALYRDEGFEPARRVPRYYEDGEAALVMVVDLDAWTRERHSHAEGDTATDAAADRDDST